ncbi:hypothetical protein MAR_031066 [Mya arenaria]|uniref:EF-hand domain-containing protein n=1 Tax=Mya arenaria TaxID=6604 RepID=A0ABY7F4C8_MYAAR|nr:uncharacterized protein LOC128205582 [Mya arenaria]WAR16472.1 hypothetical protein MAR_031066 [Mya arenaria]
MGCVTGYSCLILGLCLTHIVLAQKNNTSVGVGVEASNDDRVNGTVGMSKDLGNGVSLNAGGSLVSSGNREVKAGISWSWRSSSKDSQDRFNVTLKSDPCKFDSYDQDANGRISKKEMLSIFRNSFAAAMLFDVLDVGTVDGTITKQEFANLAAVVIKYCVRSCL